jgi:hypothetical protein
MVNAEKRDGDWGTDASVFGCLGHEGDGDADTGEINGDIRNLYACGRR